MLKPNFKQADIKKFIEKRVLLLEKQMLNMLFYVGEQAVNHARSLGNYQDQTGNLRASIGYCIIKDGKIIHSTLKVIPGSIGQEFIEKQAAGMRKGYGLVVVAGMPYAAAVESMSYDVLSSAEVNAKSEIPKLLDRIKKSMKK